MDIRNQSSNFNYTLDGYIAGGVGVLISDIGHDLLVRWVGTGDFPDTTVYLNVAGYIEA